MYAEFFLGVQARIEYLLSPTRYSSPGPPARLTSLSKNKNFDLHIPDLAFDILGAIGYPEVLVKAANSHYIGLQRFLRIGRAVGPSQEYSDPVIQGCSLSVLVTNAIYAVWTIHMECLEHVSKATFIDDCKLWTTPTLISPPFSKLGRKGHIFTAGLAS